MDKDLYYGFLEFQYYEATSKDVLKTLKNDGHLDFNEDGLDWIFERNKIGGKYVRFLNYLNKDITTKDTAELDKGIYDSIVKDYDTTVITPYHYPNRNMNKNVLHYEFFPSVNYNGLFKTDYKGRIDEILSSPEYIKRYMLLNPYRMVDLCGFEDLFNNSNYDVIVGMYGSLNDYDKEKKLKQLKILRDKIISNDIKMEIVYDKDCYFGALTTNRKIKTLGKK